MLEIFPEDTRDDESPNSILAVESFEMRRSFGEVDVEGSKLFSTRALPDLSEFDESETLLIPLGHLQESKHLVCCLGPYQVKDFEF